MARALRKDPAHRFPTAEAMRAELERIAAGVPDGGAPLRAATPLVIGEGPRSVSAGGPGAAGSSLTGFPQVGGDLRGPTPQVHQPYQPSTPPPYGPQTPPPPVFAQPYPGPHTPGPFPQQQPSPYQVGQPYPQQPYTAPQFAPQPAKGNGCSTALVVVGVIIGVIVLAVVIVAIVAAKQEQNRQDDTYGTGASTASSQYLPDRPI